MSVDEKDRVFSPTPAWGKQQLDASRLRCEPLIPPALSLAKWLNKIRRHSPPLSCERDLEAVRGGLRHTAIPRAPNQRELRGINRLDPIQFDPLNRTVCQSGECLLQTYGICGVE